MATSICGIRIRRNRPAWAAFRGWRYAIQRRLAHDRLLQAVEPVVEHAHAGEDAVHHAVEDGVEEPIRTRTDCDALPQRLLHRFHFGDGAVRVGDHEVASNERVELLEVWLRSGRSQHLDDDEEVLAEVVDLRTWISWE
jgi:hypothetical protein